MTNLSSSLSISRKLIMLFRFQGIIALFVVTVVWGTTFPAMKDLMEHFSPVWIVFIRFALAGLLLLPFLFRAKYVDIMAGGVLGAVLIICYLFQLEGLALTSSNRNAFIIGLNVLIVPLLGMIYGKVPEGRIVVAIILAMAGLFALCWDGGAWSLGDTYALWGAFFFGVYIKLMEVMTRKASDLIVLTTVQILTVTLCAGAWLLFGAREQVDWAHVQSGISAHRWNFIYLSVIATIGIMSLQAWGQRRSTANEAAVIYAMEPACAAVAAFFWLGETMAWRGIIGGLLMIAGMVVSQWHRSSRRPMQAIS